MKLLARWLATAIAVAIAAYLLPGIRLVGGIEQLLVVALVLGLVNALVRPILKWFACGLIVVTFGLFLLVINAALLLLAAWVARALGVGFYVDGFLSAFLGSLIISLISFLFSWFQSEGN